MSFVQFLTLKAPFLWLAIRINFTWFQFLELNISISHLMFFEEFDPIFRWLPSVYFMFVWSILISCYQMSISYFGVDFAPILTIFVILSDGFSALFGFVFSKQNIISIVIIFEIHKNSAFQRWFWISWFFKSILVSPKLKWIGLGRYGHVRKSENHGNEGCSAFPKVNHKRY